MEPEYSSDPRRLELIAHLGYPYAVIPHGKPRRLVTWSIHETEGRPAIEVIDYLPRIMWLVQTPTPWAVSYDCRIEVRVGSLAKDIVGSTDRYLQHLQSDQLAGPALCQMHEGLLSALTAATGPHEEADDPLYADRRNFYKVEKWSG